MPAVRGEVAAVAVGGKLYALGGNFERKALARNEEYDPVTNRWRARTPQARSSPRRCTRAPAMARSSMIPQATTGEPWRR
jgi:hypothetical protein